MTWDKVPKQRKKHSPFINLTLAEPSIISVVNTLINANEVFSFPLFTIKVYVWIWLLIDSIKTELIILARQKMHFEQIKTILKKENNFV